ncbi:hypothetical protein C8035_v000121 [Colletotrichum spinosum]|uniref:Uncharacterized protein n=1 Tax=Colletotrichum spinosum TaxID=1347390 RepID=A0A4R8PTC2_9PEZI|nr:hypothetical protein C8035_v000121 [Colletotrichum spinosum]
MSTQEAQLRPAAGGRWPSRPVSRPVLSPPATSLSFVQTDESHAVSVRWQLCSLCTRSRNPGKGSPLSLTLTLTLTLTLWPAVTSTLFGVLSPPQIVVRSNGPAGLSLACTVSAEVPVRTTAENKTHSSARLARPRTVKVVPCWSSPSPESFQSRIPPPLASVARSAAAS